MIYFYSDPFLVVAGAFFAILIDMVMKKVFVNDNDNRCISRVFGWDFGLVLSKVFVACVRQLNTIFVFIYFSFLMSPGEVVFGVVPAKNVKLCPR